MTKDDIIQMGHELFFTKGYKNTTVDYIANQLKISKKTFYRFFKTKEDYIVEVTKHRVSHFQNLGKICNERSDDVIDFYLDFLREADKISGFISGKESIADLYHYYGKMVPNYELLMNQAYENFMTLIIERGKKEKFVDEEIDIDVYLTIYANQYPFVRSSKYQLGNHDLTDTLNHMYYLLLKGLLNVRGIELLEQKENSFVIVR